MSKVNVHVRYARVSDLPSIQKLIRDSFLAMEEFAPSGTWGEKVDKLISEGDLGRDQFVAKYLQEDGKSRMWVASIPTSSATPAETVEDSKDVEGEEVVGCVSITKRGGDNGELARMAVTPHLRGLSIGKKLVQSLETYCLAHNILRVILTTANPSAARFYSKKCDFQIAKSWEVPFTLPQGEGEGGSTIGDTTTTTTTTTITTTTAINLRVFQMIKYLGERLVRKVAIIGGTHGNERIGVELVKQWTLNPSLINRETLEVVCMTGNPHAVEKNTRFIDADLNRQFASSGNTNTHSNDVEDNNNSTTSSTLESKRAQQLRSFFSSQHIDFTIDLHSTNSNMGLVAMIADGENDVIANRVAYHLVDKNPDMNIKVTHWDGSKDEAWSVDSCTCSGIAFEVGPLPHGTLSSPLLEATRHMVLKTLDYLDARNKMLLHTQSGTDIVSSQTDTNETLSPPSLPPPPSLPLPTHTDKNIIFCHSSTAARQLIIPLTTEERPLMPVYSFASTIAYPTDTITTTISTIATTTGINSSDSSNSSNSNSTQDKDDEKDSSHIHALKNDHHLLPMKWLIHPSLEGPNFQLIEEGMPCFISADGKNDTLPFLCPPSIQGKTKTGLYTAFVNEAAYQANKIAFSVYSLSHRPVI